MPIELKMPALSPTMEEGTLAKWLVKEGDEVKSGDILAEIETDKATMEFEAVDEGKIAKILVPEGTEGVKVGAPIAIMAGEGEDASAAASPRPSGEGQAAQREGVRRAQSRMSPRPQRRRKPRRNAAAPAARLRPLAPPQGRGRTNEGLAARAPARRKRRTSISRLSRAAAPAGASSAPISTRPPARRRLPLPARGAPPHRAADASRHAGADRAGIPHEAVKLSNMRKTIARRLTEAKQRSRTSI